VAEEGGLLSQAEIEALLGMPTGSSPPPPPKTTVPRTPSDVNPPMPKAPEPAAPSFRPVVPPSFQTPELSAPLPPGAAHFNLAELDPELGRQVGLEQDLSLIYDVDLNVRVELGRSRMYIEDVLKLREGSIVPLDKLAGDPVDVYVNGQLLARGEILVLNDSFCVRISEILNTEAPAAPRRIA
jgi:flagellar motor switch protein FliN/FliY